MCCFTCVKHILAELQTWAWKAHGHTVLTSPKHPWSHTGVWHFRVLFAAGKCQRSPEMCQHKASHPNSVYKSEDVKRGCQLSCRLEWQRSLLLNSQLPLGMCSWNHAQQSCVLGGLDSWFLTPENDKWLFFRSARLAKPGKPCCSPLWHSDRAFNYMVTQCFFPTELLCLSGLGMAGVFLMSICSIFGFLLLSQHVVLGTIIQTLLWIQNYSFVCKLFFSQCSLLNTSVLHKCNFASLRRGGWKEKQRVRQKKPFH